MRRSLPSGVNESTSARSPSLPQVAPSGCEATKSGGGRRDMPSATFEPEPIETSMRLPSGLKRMSRVECPPVEGASCATTVSGLPEAAVSPDR